ncbi:MAG TPA: hypothetical protein VNA28_02215 [Solirubrobacteraceae bacterium]|nr:hypothetical protein [Solirubrobacteraceae bacterium]
MRPKAIFAVMPVLLLSVLLGCGGDSSSGDGGSDAKTSAPNSPEVKKLIRQTFGPNKNATSGKLSGTIDINVKGARRYREPVQVTLSGPFNQSGSSPAEAILSVGLQLRGGAIGGELVLIDDRVLIGLGSSGYTIPPSIAEPIRRPLAKTSNGLGSVMAVFGVAPQRWAKNPRVVGNERIAGEDTIHGSAEIDTQRFFLDVAKLAKVLTSLRITEIVGIPTVVDRQARAALVRSVTSATGDVYTGADDKVLRQAGFDIKLKPSSKDRKTLGFSSLTLKGQLNITEVGTPQKIEAPRVAGTFDDLQVTFDALAEAVK